MGKGLDFWVVGGNWMLNFERLKRGGKFNFCDYWLNKVYLEFNIV